MNLFLVNLQKEIFHTNHYNLTIMKKLLLFFAITAITLTGCDPEGDEWQWWIKNSTDQTLKFKHLSYVPRTPAYSTVTIAPGDSIVLYRVGLDKSRFDYYFDKCAELSGEDVSWQILSEDNATLKSWNYSDKDLPNQRFFDELSWTYEKKIGRQAFIDMVHSWTFDILPEDITSTNQ